MTPDWHPRGEPSWPDWKQAEPGTRFEHVRSGRRGTLVAARLGRTPGATYAVVDWDPPGITVSVTQPRLQSARNVRPYRGRVVAPAFDLRPLEVER